MTIAPLLPPSSSSVRSRRLLATSATRFPIAVDPVALISEIRLSISIRSPTDSTSPMVRLNTPSYPLRSITRQQIFCTAIAVSGVSGDGFHTTQSPHTAAISAFHDHTATGKLKALITATTPSGCHCSYSRCMGRSLCIVSP
jgi:hypothetical protein